MVQDQYLTDSSCRQDRLCRMHVLPQHDRAYKATASCIPRKNFKDLTYGRKCACGQLFKKFFNLNTFINAIFEQHHFLDHKVI